jgi:hypothetical protein
MVAANCPWYIWLGVDTSPTGLLSGPITANQILALPSIYRDNQSIGSFLLLPPRQWSQVTIMECIRLCKIASVSIAFCYAQTCRHLKSASYSNCLMQTLKTPIYNQHENVTKKQRFCLIKYKYLFNNILKGQRVYLYI